jgi:predicted O-methyltransferase YrrM
MQPSRSRLAPYAADVHSREFDDVATVSSSIPGWLTREQARVLFEAAAAVPPGGCVVEIGSHRGRSTVVLASALPPGARMVAVDPFVTDWRYGGADTEQALTRNLQAAGVAGIVEVRRSTSAVALARWAGPVDLLYVDGKHDVLSLLRDLRWARWLPDGGTVLVHDAFSSVGVTLGLGWALVTGRFLTYVDRTGSLARLAVRRPTAVDRVRWASQLLWWFRNLGIKLLLRLRLRRMAGLFAHYDDADPY